MPEHTPASPSLSPDDIHWMPSSIVDRVNFSELFRNPGPVTVDYGCGEGAFVIAMAKRHPNHNFLATERLALRVEKVCKTAARLNLSNIRVLRLENLYIAKYLLPSNAVSTSYVCFPDPWPKRAHQSRRLVQPEFLSAVRETLTPGGELRLKTDDLPYFQWMEKVIAMSEGWDRMDWPDNSELPMTNFEARFVAQGLPIYSTLLRKRA